VTKQQHQRLVRICSKNLQCRPIKRLLRPTREKIADSTKAKIAGFVAVWHDNTISTFHTGRKWQLDLPSDDVSDVMIVLISSLGCIVCTEALCSASFNASAVSWFSSAGDITGLFYSRLHDFRFLCNKPYFPDLIPVRPVSQNKTFGKITGAGFCRQAAFIVTLRTATKSWRETVSSQITHRCCGFTR